MPTHCRLRAPLATLLVLVSITAALFSTALAGSNGFSADPWPEAGARFRQNGVWLGGDGAVSVDLGGGRVLWLFGDSFVAPQAGVGRQRAVVIRNSLAIQKGRDPQISSIRFYWAKTPDGPAAFFGANNDRWLWPAGGLVVAEQLVVFFMRLRPAGNALGFDYDGWCVAAIDDFHKPPAKWAWRWLKSAAGSPRVALGAAGVLRRGDFLFAWGARQSGRRELHLARWPLSCLRSGDLSAPHWWMGRSRGWAIASPGQDQPEALFAEAPAEMSIHWESCLRRYFAVQTQGFGAGGLYYRTARRPWGPWSEPRVFFHPPEFGQSQALIYAARAHPELTGSQLVVTYMVGHLDFARLLRDYSLYYPRFLKGRFRASASASARSFEPEAVPFLRSSKTVAGLGSRKGEASLRFH
jgi:hypothetical protein